MAKENSSWQRKLVTLLTVVSLSAAGFATVLFPAYQTALALEQGDVVRLRLRLHKAPWKTPEKAPWRYEFSAGGERFAGTEFLAENAPQYNRATDTATAQVVYLRADPSHHRMEPVTEIAGTPVPEYVPLLVKVAAGALLAGWLVSSSEHFWALLFPGSRGGSRAGDHVGLIIANTLALVLLPGLAITVVAAVLSFVPDFPLYRDERLGWIVAAVVNLLLLLGPGLLGPHLERRIERQRELPPPSNTKLPNSRVN